jgi:GNAT superfamily N-acetyltransferase
MQSEMNQLSQEDYSTIARIHRDSLEQDFPSSLGNGYLIHLYRFLDNSPMDEVIVQRTKDGHIVAGLVLSYNVGTIFGRVIKGTFFYFIYYGFIKFFSSTLFRNKLVKIIKRVLTGNNLANSPEIVYLFTDQAYRNQGLAAELVHEAEEFSRISGAKMCYVKTLADPKNMAILFYLKHGFHKYHEMDLDAGRFVFFKKSIYSESINDMDTNKTNKLGTSIDRTNS